MKQIPKELNNLPEILGQKYFAITTPEQRKQGLTVEEFIKGYRSLLASQWRRGKVDDIIRQIRTTLANTEITENEVEQLIQIVRDANHRQD